MKLKAAIISLLSAMLIVGIVTAALLVTETKRRTEIALETIAEMKKQTESTVNTERETKRQTEIALKTADLISIQIDITSEKLISESISKKFGYQEQDPVTNSSYNTAFRRKEMEKIRKSLGLIELHSLGRAGNYDPSNELIDIVRPNE